MESPARRPWQQTAKVLKEVCRKSAKVARDGDTAMRRMRSSSESENRATILFLTVYYDLLLSDEVSSFGSSDRTKTRKTLLNNSKIALLK